MDEPTDKKKLPVIVKFSKNVEYLTPEENVIYPVRLVTAIKESGRTYQAKLSIFIDTAEAVIRIYEKHPELFTRVETTSLV